MSDPEMAPAAPSEQDPSIEPREHNQDESITKLGPSGFSFSIWPPTQRTRDAVINRLIETLSTPSVLSKRYGTLSPDDAAAAARQIEDESFSAAAASAASDDDGIEILQVYSKEISKRMLDTVKERATTASAAAADNVISQQTPTSDVPPPPSSDAEGAVSDT